MVCNRQMYNFIEYSDNGNVDLTINNSQLFKYKTALLGKTADAVANANSSVKEAKIIVPLKYLSNFWRSLEMPLINCKVYHELNWIEESILSSDGNTAKFAITDTTLYVPIITLSTKDSANLAKQLNEGFERSVYWNNYEGKPAKVIEQGKNLYELLNASFQGVKRLFVLVYVIAAGDNADQEAGIKGNKKYFLLRGEIKN